MIRMYTNRLSSFLRFAVSGVNAGVPSIDRGRLTGS